MRLTISEQAIIRSICNANVAATRHHIVAHTGLSFLTVDECLSKLIITNRLVLLANGGFGLTELTKCNPVVRLMLQEKVEERLWVQGGSQQHRKIVQRLVDSIATVIHYRLSFSKKII